jgi:hypothetical protein
LKFGHIIVHISPISLWGLNLFKKIVDNFIPQFCGLLIYEKLWEKCGYIFGKGSVNCFKSHYKQAGIPYFACSMVSISTVYNSEDIKESLNK